jgi:MoxR-like ATPase
LFRACKAQAFLRGRGFVTLEDVKSIITLVLRHRLILNFEAEAENITTDDVVKEIVSEVEVI